MWPYLCQICQNGLFHWWNNIINLSFYRVTGLRTQLDFVKWGLECVSSLWRGDTLFLFKWMNGPQGKCQSYGATIFKKRYLNSGNIVKTIFKMMCYLVLQGISKFTFCFECNIGILTSVCIQYHIYYSYGNCLQRY